MAEQDILTRYIDKDETIESFIHKGINRGFFKFSKTPSVEAITTLSNLLRKQGHNPSDFGLWE